MFEFNGREYSAEDIQREATAQGVDYNEYLDFLKGEGLVEKTEDPQIQQSAPAESIDPALDTELSLDDTFLVSPQDEEEADFLDKLGNIFKNQIPTVKNAWESTKANLVDYVKFMGGKDAADFFVGESDGGIAFKDESTGETVTFKDNPETWKQIANDPNRDSYPNIKTIYKDTGKEVGEATDEFLIDTFKQIEKNKLEYKDTGKGIVGGFKEGNIGDVVLGAVNGLTSVVTTAGPAMMTGGATLIPQVVAPMYTEYNMEKAKAKYGEDDPNAFEKLVENNETELGAPAVLGATAYALEKIGVKGIGKYIASKSFAGKQAVKLISTGSKEGLTEYFQGAVEQINQGLAQGQDYEKVVENTWDWMQSDEALENFAQGFVGSTGMSTSGRAISNAMKSSEQAKQDIYRQINVISSLNQAIRETNSNELKESYQEDLAIAEQNLREIVEENNRKAELLSKEQKDNVISNINQRKALRDKTNKLIKQKDQGIITQQEFDTAAERIKKQNQQIDDNIEVIRKSASDKLVQENIDNVKKAAKNTYGDDVQIKELSAEEVKQYIRDNFKNLDKDQQESLTEEAAASQGFFEGAVIDGKQDIIINKDVTQETSGINVASHEFLHKVLSQSLDDKSRIEVGSALINQLAKMDLPQLEGSKFAKRLQLYKDKPESVQAEEILTLLSDAIRSGDLDFKEGVFARLGNTVRRGLQNAGIRKIKFDSGRDIYNFIKDYNKSIEKGILKGTVKEAAVEGVTGKLVEQPVVNIKDDVTKFSKEIASQEVQDIFNEQGEAGAFDIIEKFKPITTRIARRFREVPGYDEELVISEIEIGQRGMFDLIRGYNPESANYTYIDEDGKRGKVAVMVSNDGAVKIGGTSITELQGADRNQIQEFIEENYGEVVDRAQVPLAGYINKFLPARSIEAGNRILKTEFEEDVTEAKAVTATETAEDIVETSTRDEGRKTKAKVIADELQIADKVASEVAEADIDPNTLTNFKSVPNAVRNTVGEMLGISPKKIQTKANLTKDEVANAQRWFNRNAQLVIDALPQGFDVEGKATGVPKTVLAALYTQKETRAKTKAGLKGQVKRTNIKNSEFLELVDIVDGKPTRDRNTSARIIALADLLGKTITNQELRKTQPDLARIRSGMSDVMFSKAIRSLDTDKQAVVFENISEVGAAINPAYTNVKDLKAVKRELSKIYGDKLTAGEINNIAKELGRLAEVYEPVVSNNDVVPEKTWTEFVADSFDQAADNIIEALGLTIDGKVPTGASIYDSIDNVARGRRAVIELGHYLIDQGKTAEEVARVMAILKPMYAGAGKIARGNISVDDSGNLFYVDKSKFGSPRGQVFNNVGDFENNAVFRIQGVTPEVWKSTNKKLLAQSSSSAVKNPNYEERLAEAREAQEAIGLMMEFLNNSDLHNDLDVAMFMISNLSNMGAPLRRAANLQYIADAVLKMDPKKLGELAEYEHLIPANYMAIKIIQTHKQGNVDTDNLYKNYKVAIIPKTMDDVIKKQGLQSKMHAGYDFENDASTDRYYNFLTAGFKDIVTIRDISTKEVIGPKVKLLDNPIERTKKSNLSEAISNARPVMQYSKTSRGMSTFDFDETLIIEGENFIVAKKGDDVQRISSGDWPLKGPQFAADGYEFDFTDFVNVRGGVDGPLLQKMKNQIKKYGAQNVFVLTARPAESATAIHEWLKTKGVNIPFENITGLGNSTGDAKAAWMLDKYAEGYNDMYFVDDALPNVEAVQHVFDQLDVKGKSIQAKIQFSKGLSPEFNKMLERTKGVGAEKTFSRISAQKRGKNVGRFNFFVPPSADDFAGLLRYFVGRGEQGNKDLEFFNKALIKPFARADRDMKEARQAILDDHKALRKEMPQVAKKLGDMIDDSGFTFDNAVRVYLWDKAGFEIPGLSKRDIAFLTNRVKTDQDLRTYADIIGQISKRKEGYIKPSEYWNVESIASDLENIVNKEGRKKYLAEWIENKDEIFSKENLNKIEAAYGSNFREALENILWRMENGTNRAKGMGRLEAAWNNWVNNSVGAIMFFNARSAVLQTLSTVNFINFEDNNIFAAAKAFGNQKQYWKDFSFLFNSDFLKQRRAGLQTNINEAELASAVAGAANKAKAALQYLLKIGFTPTQIADSFAIAAGGSTYYRNRIKKYVKEGMSQADAESQAMLDFQEIAEETQQSARPDRISQQQASSLGRIILAFANTPMQYNRLIKKAAGDLVNGRGDWRSNVSRIVYYGAVQNIIFSSLQAAIFALAFDDEEPEQDEIDKKSLRLLNGMVDSLLRGSGLAGAVVSTLKNTVTRFLAESKKDYRADYGNVLVDALNVSPPIGSKARKLYNATKTYKYNKEAMGDMSTFDLENPIWDATGNVVSATTNVPLDRGFRKIDNMKEALNQDNQLWQRIFVGLGWDQWSLGIDSKEGKKSRPSGRKDIREAREKRAKEIERARKQRLKRLR